MADLMEMAEPPTICVIMGCENGEGRAKPTSENGEPTVGNDFTISPSEQTALQVSRRLLVYLEVHVLMDDEAGEIFVIPFGHCGTPVKTYRCVTNPAVDAKRAHFSGRAVY